MKASLHVVEERPIQSDSIISVTSKVQLVTPELAKKYLESQITNRKWRRDVVDRYKKEMLEGRWKINGQPIIFNNNNQLMDGQHRLMALIEANKAIKMFIVSGVQSGFETSIDMGKSRTLGDVFQMKGIRNARLLSRTSKLLLIWTEHMDELIEKRTFTRNLLNVNPEKIYQFYLKNQLDIDRACSEFKKNTPIITNTGAAVLSFVFRVLEKIDIEKCYAFITSYTSGHIKKEWAYMLRIRDDILNRIPTSKVRLTEAERISLLFGMWNVIYNSYKIDEVEKSLLNIPNEILNEHNRNIR